MTRHQDPVYHNRPVYIVDGNRTPFIKAKGVPGPFSASDLATASVKRLLLDQHLDSQTLDELILGCVIPGPDEANIARVVSLRAGCDSAMPAWTVQRNCASAMQAIDSAAKDIASGRHDLVAAGGTEAMSHAPVLFNQQAVRWLGQWMKAKKWHQKLALLARLRPGMLKPVIGLLHGLTDPVVQLNTGQTAENLAYEFGISRQEMDSFAVESHQRLAQAVDDGRMDELIALYDHKGHCFNEDTGLRWDTNVDQLAKLKPYFDKPFGLITAGNSSQVTDGASMVLLASESAVNEYKLPVRGIIRDAQWAGLAPEVMGLGPVYASTPIMRRQQLGLGDIDYWEINEAFAAQVLACNRAWADKNFCQNELGLKQAMGAIDHDKLNVDGGAIALGHPVGASGSRIVLHLLTVLERQNARRGIATLCVGGGQGGAMLIERPQSEERS